MMITAPISASVARNGSPPTVIARSPDSSREHSAGVDSSGMLSNLQRARVRALAWAAVPLALALITAAGRLAGVNAPTIGSIYLLVVLGLAAWGGWAVGATASVAAMLCFNYFFLPPLGTLTIAEPA